MFRFALLGGALSAIVAGTILSAPAEASPVCVWGTFTHPVPRTIPPTCVPYPLETICSTSRPSFAPVLAGELVACVPNPLVLPRN